MKRALAFGTAALFMLSACASILGFERLTEEGGPADGSIAEGSVGDASTSDADTADATAPFCPPIAIPGPPGNTGNQDAGHAILAALNLLDFGITAAGTGTAGTGFNLDGVCSTSTQTTSCAIEADGPTFDRYGRDRGDAGIDNASASLFEDLAFVSSSIRPAEINARLRNGDFGGVVRISDWNGTPNDEKVTIELIPALGVVTMDAGKVPSFNPTDTWTPDSRFEYVAGTEVSALRDLSAYVSGSRLVAYFEKLTIPILIPNDPKPFDVLLREVHVAATIQIENGRVRLTDGTIGGRWKTNDFLDQVRKIYIESSGPFEDVYMCELPFIYDEIKKSVCKGRDIRSTSRDDNQAKACDSFSIGVRFDTYAVAKLGDFEPGPTIDPRCGANSQIDASDDCP